MLLIGTRMLGLKISEFKNHDYHYTAALRLVVLPLALYAHRMHANGNVSRMFAIGNSAMWMDSYIYQRTFGEQFIMAVMNELMPENTISLDIMASAAFRPALTAGSQHLGVGLIVAMPLLCLAAALVALLPRRNR